MDLSQRLKQLETVHDWQGLVEELERGIAGESDAAKKAGYHLALGKVLDEKFLQGVKALKHFQDAYKLNSQMVEALERARGVYWDLGKTNMVQKLLELELKTVQEGAPAAVLLLELGDVLLDAGDADKAAATYARALAAASGLGTGADGRDLAAEARASLEDVQLDEGSWNAHVADLVSTAAVADVPREKAQLFLRAARIARRFAPAEVEGFLARAYAADPEDRQVAALYEGLLVEAGRADALEAAQQRILGVLDGTERARAALRYGARWATRHQSPERGARLLEESFSTEPANVGAFAYLRDLWGAKEGNWDRVLGLVEKVSQNGSKTAYLLAQGGTISWRNQGNLMKARSWFERLKLIAPEHPSISAFELQIGEKLTPRSESMIPPAILPSARPPAPIEDEATTLGSQDAQDARDTSAHEPEAARVPSAAPPAASEPPPAAASEPPPAAAPSEPPAAVAPSAPPPSEEAASAAAPSVPPPSEPASDARAGSAPSISVAPSAPPPAAPPAAAPPAAPAADADRVHELRARAEKQKAAKRFNEYVRTLVELAEAVDDPDEKLALYLEAAELYTTKFSNAAEAVKAYEAILTIDETNSAALDFLKQSYEKRRDWEKLIGLNRREAAALPFGAERTAKFLEIARLANERVKKPEVCIGLWQEVLESDGENAEALGALGGLYERAKEFDKLAEVLEKQVEVTYDSAQQEQIYGKLGQLYGERLNDDQKAVDAWRKLLAINPSERKAQEALKKKYLALGQWDDLEVFYAESGKWDEFIRLLESQESKETDDAAKVSLLMKTAQLWMTQKGKPDRAARAYEKVLSLDPSHLAAAEALAPIYASTNNAKGLATAIEVKLQHAGRRAEETGEGTEERVELLREVAGLYETKLKDPEKAFERYLTAFELAPGDERSAEDVERAAHGTGGWDALIRTYERTVAKTESDGDVELGIALRLRLGRVLLQEVQRVDDALAQFRAVYDADGENQDAIAALEGLYQQTGRFQDLLGIHEKKRDLAATPEDRRTALYAIAEIQETRLGDKRGAVDTYRQVVDDEAMDPRALAALDRLYLQLEDWEPYAEVLRNRILLDVPEEELVDLKYRLGSTLEKHLGDAAGALQNYREILFLDPGNEPATQALEHLLAHAELRAEAAGILREIYEGKGDWEKLIQSLTILSEAEEDTTQRVALLRKIAQVSADNLNDLDRAMTAQAAALKADPANVEARDELEALAARAEAWSRLDEIFSGIAADVTDADLAREYLMRLGAISERLGKVDEAAASYQKVLSLDPGDGAALAAMESLYARTQRWDDLVGVHRRRIELETDPAAREALYAQMAGVYEERLGRPDDAIAAYREVLALDDQSHLALVALDGLFTRQQRWEDLAENLEAQLALAGDPELQSQLMLRLADLRETRMQQVETAIDIYNQVLERDPENLQALAALERLGTLPAHELAIAEILEPLYRQMGDWQKLVGVHEVQVRRSDDAARRVELLHQIAALYEDAGQDLDSTFDTYARALAEDPASDVTQAGIDRLARATGRFADLAQVYERLAAAQEDRELACQLTSMAAAVHENDLGQIDHAVALYRRVLSIDPSRLEAAESLDRIFRATERYEELSAVLQQKAGILDELHDKKASLFQAASIEEDVLARPDSAIAVYRQILELDQEDTRAIDALVKLFLGLSRWSDLLAVYQQKADLVVDVDEKKSIYYQVGAVRERELGDVAAAIDTYQRVLELDPDDLNALSRLDVLYQQAQNWPELLSVLQHEAELAGDPAESISYQYRIAELYERHLDDVPRAIELYRDLLQQMPDHQPTLSALEGIKSGSKEPLGASLVLEPIYDATGEWTKLVSVLEVQVTHASDAYAKVDLLHRIARLYEEMLSDHASAFQTYARAVALDVTNEESLASFERLASVVDRWRDVAALYDEQLTHLREDPARFVELGLRVAEIVETYLENVDGAVARYRMVLEVDPENRVAISSLDRLFSATERWSDLVPVLQREADIGETPDDILNFKYRLGQVHQLKLGSIRDAIKAYSEVLAAAPEHQDALTALEGLFAQAVEAGPNSPESGRHQLEIGEILEPLYQASGDWEKLAAVLEAELASLSEQPDRLAMYYRIAELHEERLVNGDMALATYLRALKEVPSDERVGEEVERLAGVVDGGWEQLANAYADVLGLHQDKAVQTAIGRKLARVFEEELGDISKAEETYRYVLGVDPKDERTLVELDRIYTSLEQYPELAQILEQRVLATAEPYELIELYARLGQTYEERLAPVAPQHNDDAIRAFRRIFDELEPSSEIAMAALERIYGHKEQWVELREVLERQLQHAQGDSHEAEIRAKTAHLLADRLGDTPKAVETWQRVLDLRGEDPEALFALANLHERTQHWAELAEVLERHYAIADADEDRVAILLRRAKLFDEQLGRDDSALDDYIRVLDVDYGNVQALYAIADIWRRRNEPRELVGALHQTVDRGEQRLLPEQLVALHREIALLYQGVLEQPFDAIDAWRRLLQVDPAHLEAMQHLEALLRAEQRWEEVIDVKMQRARALPEPSEQVREYLEAAALWDNPVGDKDRGTPAYEAVLQIEPTNDVAFHTLEELHNAARRAEPLIELLLARLDTRDDVKEKTVLLRKVAKAFEEYLDDKPQAFDALVTAFELDVSDMETVRYLERIAQATNKWPELIQNVNGWVQAESDPTRKIALCLRLAKWYAEDLGHPEYAQPYYQQVLKLDPNNVQVLRQMANFFKKSARWQEQGQMLTSALNNAVGEQDRKEILTELGEVLEQRMNEQEQGIAFYKRALDVDPHFVPALEKLERIYETRGQTQDLVDSLVAKAKGQTQPEQIAATRLKAAGLYETSLGQVERAGQVYREALDADGSNLLAMRGLERVYGARRQWQDLVGILEMQLDVVATERERIDTLLKIARIQEEEFLKPDAAAVRLEQVVEIDPNQEAAYEGLERCYRKMRHWHDLIGAYDRHVNATLDRGRKVELYHAMALVHADELEDADRAIDAYLNIIDIDPTNVAALEALSKLYEKRDDSARAIDYMTRVAELTVDGRQRVETYFRIGKQLDEKLGERFQAQEYFEKALDLEPAHLPSLASLRTIALDQEDWDRAVRYLDQEQTYTEAPRARAKLLVELGNLREHKLGEHELAVQAWELALQCDADSEDAALPLLDEYIAKEQWAQAEPLAEMLARKANRRERHEQHQLFNKLGKVQFALGDFQAALRAYQTANQLDLTSQETIRGLGETCFKLEDWPGALTNFQKVLTSLDETESDDRAYVYYRLGQIKQAQGQPKQAINNFEKALGVVANHRPTLDALVALYEGAKDWKQVNHYKRAILDDVMDAGERFKMLVDIGDIWADKEGERDKNEAPRKAGEAYEEALSIEPQNHVVLHKALKIYQVTSQWDSMIDVLQRIADLESNPERKSRYLFTMAQIYRDKLEDQSRAVDLFNDALDLNPGYLEAFERINKILTAQKEWKQLERAYRKMLHRIAGKGAALGNADLEYNLWHALGLIYRDRLGDQDKAIEAFRMASRLKPEDATEHMILAELFETTDQLDAAIAEHQAIIKIDPMQVEPYKKLYALYLTKKDYDPAWCLAAVLSFLHQAGEEETQFFNDYKPAGMVQARARLDNEGWVKRLFHEDENLFVGKIFEMIAAAALRAKIEGLKAKKELPNLDPRFRQDPATSTVTFTRTFGWAANVLGLPTPPLYVRSDVPGALVHVPADHPSSLAGQTVLSGVTPQELTFIVGKHLSYYRGEHFIKTLFPTVTELTVLFFAGIKLAAPEAPTPKDIEKMVVTTAQQLGQFMQPVHLEGLRIVVKKFIAEGAVANLKRWSQAVEISASRAGLLLCGDLDIAKSVIAKEMQQPGDLTPAEKVKELLVFAASENYFQLRRQLGIQIQVEGG